MHKPSFYINLNGLCGRYKKQATICFQFLKCSKKGFLKKCILISNHTPARCLTVTNSILADSYSKLVCKRLALPVDRSAENRLEADCVQQHKCFIQGETITTRLNLTYTSTQRNITNKR